MIVNNLKPVKVFSVLLIAIGLGTLSFAQTTGTNWVRTRVPKIPVTDTSKLDTIPVQRQAVSISYTDGLGRPLQGIQMMGSATLKDVVQPYVYDNMGRPAVRYLPYADQSTTTLNAGQFRSNAVANVLNFYNAASPGAPKIPTDAAPYAQTVYEATPLGRVNEQGAVGSVFQPGTGHTKRASYNVNTDADGIYSYQVSEENGVSIFSGGFFSGGLTKTTMTDENNHRLAVWRDLQGRMVTKSMLDAPYPFLYITNYVYNDLNQLTDILLPSPNTGGSPQVNYIFHYDSVGRVVEKKVPDKGWMYSVYNHANQPVLVQDSNMRAKNQWIFMKYDAEGRVVENGLYVNSTVTTRRAMQHLCDTNFLILWETWQPGTGYTNNAFPQQSAIPGASPLNIYVTYYYDDYSFNEAAAKPFQTNIYNTSPSLRIMGFLTGTSTYVLGTVNQRLVTVNYYDNQERLIQVQRDNHLGQVDIVNFQYNFIGDRTGTQRKTTPIAGNTITVKDRYVYDQGNRLLDTYESIQSSSELDISHNLYNEIGEKVTEGLHSTNYNGANPLEYMGVGPMPSTITENTNVTVGKSDIAGTSITLNPGFSFTATTTNNYFAGIGYSFAQNQEFRYNIRGWLTNINNGTLTNDGVTQMDPNSLFGESIYYFSTSPLSGTPLYNGNISAITWRNKIEQTGLPGLTTGGQGYTFSYDSLDRLTQTSYYTQSGSSFVQNSAGALTEVGINYDGLGNIQNLQRKDKNGNLINNLTYTYGPPSQNQLLETNANQLMSIGDSGSQNISGNFSYDGNGNMTGDSYKGIAITYNYLDLPDTVKQGVSKLVFTYDATGNKLYKQLITSGSVVSQRHYIEDAEVTATSSIAYDGKVESIAMAEGRILNKGLGNYQYEYYLEDHLYNNRVNFQPNTDGTLTMSLVQNYYPFGADMGDATMNYSASPQNLYLYNTKELQPELNLNSYDFGARHYNAVLGRWNSVDPFAENYEEMSPYNYVFNNPMNMIDPDGMQPGTPDFTFGSSGEGLGSASDFTGITRYGGNVGSGGSSLLSGLGYGATILTAGSQLFSANRAFEFHETTQNWGGLANVQQNTLAISAGDVPGGTTFSEPPGASGILGKLNRYKPPGWLLGLDAGDQEIPFLDIASDALTVGWTIYNVATDTKTKVHGNDDDNNNPHIVYEIFSYDFHGDRRTEKFGISGQEDNDNGSNPRPAYQCNKFNKMDKEGRHYGYIILARVNNRVNAKIIEKSLVTLYFRANKFNLPPKQILPYPDL